MVIEEVVLTTGHLGKLIHILLDDCRSCIVKLINRLATGEVYIRILSSTAHGWTIWSQCARAVSVDEIFVNHLKHIIIGELLDFLNFSRGPETIKEMHERNAGLKGGLGGD